MFVYIKRNIKFVFNNTKRIFGRVKSNSSFPQQPFYYTMEEQELTDSKSGWEPGFMSFLESKKYSSGKRKIEIGYEDEDSRKSGKSDGTSSMSRAFSKSQPLDGRGATEKDGEESKSSKTEKVKGPNPINNYREIFNKIKEMRSASAAPVDSMGVGKAWDQDSGLDPSDKKFQVLVELILSVQTRDEMTSAAIKHLYKVGLTIDSVDQMTVEELANHIASVNFRNNKAKYIKGLASLLKEKMARKIPNTLEDLVKLPGIGPKIALLYLQIAENKVQGIAVDTHVHRISNRIGWVKSKQPEETRLQLQSWVPKEDWSVINEMLVGFGQTICNPINPKCKICKVNDLCEFGRNRADVVVEKSKGKKKVKKNKEVQEDETTQTKVAGSPEKPAEPPKSQGI